MYRQTKIYINENLIALKLFQYGPNVVRGLKSGEKKLWCACGLSKKQPGGDGWYI